MKNNLNEDHYNYLRTEIFSKRNELHFYQLKELHNKKVLLKELQNKIIEKRKPFVVEFYGTPRAGKTTIINNLQDFFKKGGFKVKLLEEPASLINSSIIEQQKLKEMSQVEFNNLTLEIALKELEKVKNEDYDLVFMDRGILDNFVWYEMFFRKQIINENEYRYFMDELLSKQSGKVNSLILTYCNSKEAVKRDYLNSITLEPRRKINEENINLLNESTIALTPRFEQLIESYLYLDTSNLTEVISAMQIAEKLISDYQTYLEINKSNDKTKTLSITIPRI